MIRGRRVVLLGEEGGEFLASVEVAHGGGGKFHEFRFGEFPDGGGAHAAAGEPVKFASGDAEGVVVGADRFESARVGGVEGVLEEYDVDGVDVGFHLGAGKRLRGGDGGHFVGGAEEGVDRVAEGFREVLFDLGFEFGGAADGGLEKDIAARDEGGDAAEIEGFEVGAKGVHFDAALAEIDAAEEGDVVHGVGASGLTGLTAREEVGDVDAAGAEFFRL